MLKATYETCVEAPGPQGPLKGTLLSPCPNPKNVVLIIPGSGPTDQNGNNPLGINASTYRLLAEELVLTGRIIFHFLANGSPSPGHLPDIKVKMDLARCWHTWRKPVLITAATGVVAQN